MGLIKNIFTGVKLSQITFPNGKVDFIPGQVRTDLNDGSTMVTDTVNTSATTLGAIQITNSDSSFCKKYTFSYGYFIDNVTPFPTLLNTYNVRLQTDRSRLRLDSVKEQTCDGSLQIPARSFTYFNEMVPRRLTLALDHWGFFNGQTNNQTLIPTFTELNGPTGSNVVAGANRDAAWPTMRGGSLNKITYPTGVSVFFDFEPADNYNKFITTSQLENIDQTNASVHMFGQDSIFSQTMIFFSNGQHMYMTAHNYTQDYLASVIIKDSTGTTVYSTTFGNDSFPSGSKYFFDLAALGGGTYSITLSIPVDYSKPEGQGVTVFIQQNFNVTQTYNITIGGLRIKTITQQDCANNSIPIITSYSYPAGGYLYSFPTYLSHVRNDLYSQLGFWEVTSDTSGFFVQGIGSNGGCPVGGTDYERAVVL